MQNQLYLLCFLQSGEVTSANLRIFTVLAAIQRGEKCKITYIYCAFAIRKGKKCKIAYIYCAFCNFERYKVQIRIYLLCFLQFGDPNGCPDVIF